jgi:phospho-N-acetylmuramoyl-pentapeptide-transferase
LLYWLLFVKLQHYFPPFRIFRYLTFRTAFASLTALFTALIVGPLVINRLREFQIGQYIREEGPKAHQKKAGRRPWAGC